MSENVPLSEYVPLSECVHVSEYVPMPIYLQFSSQLARLRGRRFRVAPPKTKTNRGEKIREQEITEIFENYVKWKIGDVLECFEVFL